MNQEQQNQGIIEAIDTIKLGLINGQDCLKAVLQAGKTSEQIISEGKIVKPDDKISLGSIRKLRNLMREVMKTKPFGDGPDQHLIFIGSKEAQKTIMPDLFVNEELQSKKDFQFACCGVGLRLGTDINPLRVSYGEDGKPVYKNSENSPEEVGFLVGLDSCYTEPGVAHPYHVMPIIYKR